MNHYFVSAYFQNFLMESNYVGTEEVNAYDTFIESNTECPHDFIRFNEDSKMVEVADFCIKEEKCVMSWRPVYKAWVAVRHNPGFDYPETVISKDGIFETLSDAKSFIKENGGSWKIYSFVELQNKLIESKELMDIYNKRKETTSDLFDDSCKNCTACTQPESCEICRMFNE